MTMKQIELEYAYEHTKSRPCRRKSPLSKTIIWTFKGKIFKRPDNSLSQIT